MAEIDPHAALMIAALTVALLLGILLFRVLKANLGLILTILAIVLVLRYGFEISLHQLWVEIGNLPQEVIQFVKHFDSNSFVTTKQLYLPRI